VRIFDSPRRGHCASCESIITGRPVFQQDEAYCCLGCAQAHLCVCNAEADLADDGVDGLGLLASFHTLEPADALVR
jgi:hypothetical protein